MSGEFYSMAASQEAWRYAANLTALANLMPGETRQARYAALAPLLPSPVAKAAAECGGEWNKTSFAKVNAGEFTAQESWRVFDRSYLLSFLLQGATGGAPAAAITGAVANMALFACCPELSATRAGAASRRAIFNYDPIGA